MNLTILAVCGIVSLLVLIFIGMDIGMSMLIVGGVGYYLATNGKATIGLLAQAPATQAAEYALCVVPLFILMGNLCFASGMSGELFEAGDKWLGKLPGGLGCATVAACAVFGAICGSPAATAATMGVVAIPEMRKYGYDDGLSCGAVSVGGTLGIMIPPSTAFIVYGITAEQSIGRLFAAGVIPGIILAVFCCATIVLQVKLNPALAPSTDRKITWKDRFRSLKGLVWVVALFLIVLGGMFCGFFTVNESAAIGALGGFVIMVLRRKFSWRAFMNVLRDTVKTTAMTYLILIGAGIFGKFLAITQVPMAFASAVEAMHVNRYVVFALIMVIYAIMGCFIDCLPMITMTVPIFLPVMEKLGFDPIWFGIVMTLVLQLGLVTPPVGLNCYVIGGIAKDVPLFKIFKGALPFVPAIILAIVVCTAFPQLATWLPTVFYG